MTDEEMMQYILDKYGDNPTWTIPSPKEKVPGETLPEYVATITIELRGGTIGKGKSVEMKFHRVMLKDMGTLVAAVVQVPDDSEDFFADDPQVCQIDGPYYLDLHVERAMLRSKTLHASNGLYDIVIREDEE